MAAHVSERPQDDGRAVDHTRDPQNPRVAVAPLDVRRELSILTAGAVIYFGGRVLVEGSTSRSVANAERLLDVEGMLGVDVESQIQRLALDYAIVREIGNLSYVWLHWPLLLTILGILFMRDPGQYRRLRSALFLSGGIGLVLFTVFPMAPPRFMDGFVGTVSDDARRHYLGYPLSWANKYAAFPSFHVGWTLIACIALAISLRHRTMSAFALVPAGLVGFAVISTGNHYVIDAVTGALIALVAYAAYGRIDGDPTLDEAPPMADGSRV